MRRRSSAPQLSRSADDQLVAEALRAITIRHARPGVLPGHFAGCQQDGRSGDFNKAIYDTEQAAAEAARQKKIAAKKDFWYYPCHLAADEHWHLTTKHGRQVQEAITAARGRA